MSEALQKKINFDYAQIGGVRLHYAYAGNGEKLVILLHGFPEFWYSWRHQIVDLSDEYTVVAPDMRGYNLSDKPGNVSDYALDKLVDDVIGLINNFGRKKAHIVGHDWGAAVAWEMATKHPEYVEKLITMQVPPFSIWQKNMSFKQFCASWYMFFFLIPKLPEWILSQDNYNNLAEKIIGSTVSQNVFSDQDITEYKKSWSKDGTLTGALNYYRANVISRIFSTQSNEKVRVPTLFIYGEQDAAVLPQTVENIGDIIDADYQEIRIPESAHWVQNEAPQAVTDSIRDFIK